LYPKAGGQGKSNLRRGDRQKRELECMGISTTGFEACLSRLETGGCEYGISAGGKAGQAVLDTLLEAASGPFRGVSPGIAVAAWGRDLEARLLALQRSAGYFCGGIRPRVQGTTSHRRVPAACQERGGPGRLPGANVGGLAPPSNLIPRGHLIADAGSQAGK